MAEERIRIEIAANGLEARWKIEPGEPLEREAVRSALEDAGVRFGVDSRLVIACEDRIHDERYAQPEVVIARGRPPLNGRDGRLEMEVDSGPHPGTRRADGSLDWLDRCWLTRVEEGDELGLLLKPTNGKPGMRVDGEEIPATPGKPCAVATGEGVEVGEDGVIRAVRNGAIQYRRGEKIDVLEHYEHSGDVDIRSGHLKSRGSVTVTGNVNENFEVKAQGDVAVNGSVYGGRIIADGRVQIGRGVSGGEGGFVEAGGDLVVHHAQSSRLRSGGAVVIARDCVSTQLYARRLEVGSALRGGESVVETLILTRDAGSGSGAGTTLRVGEPYECPREAVRREAMDQKIRRAVARQRSNRSRDRLVRAKGGRESRDRVALDREKTKHQRERAARRNELLRIAQIDVTGTANVGVQIHIGNCRLSVEEPLSATRFKFDEASGNITATRLEK